MDEAEAALLRETAQIIDDESALATLMDLFGLGRRQAWLTLTQIRKNFVYSSRKAGLPLDEFIRELDAERKMGIFGFCAGVVCQRDSDLRLDPETGDRKPGPDYDI